MARSSLLGRLRRRLRADDGFGLIELTISMSVLAIGLLALFSTFSSGYVTLRRASIQGTASLLADKAMEKYRGMQYSAISSLSPTTYSSTSNPPSPDGNTYTVSTTVTSAAATNTSGGSARTVKVVTVTVTDGNGKQWASEQSTFDPLTGQ